MSWYRWVLCGLCLVVADGAWLYPLLGFMGFIAGLGHAPVSLAALEGVLLISALTAALASILPAARTAGRVLKPVMSTLCVWLGVFFCASRVGVDAGLAWPVELLALRYPASAAAGLLTVTAVLAWCWWHAGRRLDDSLGAPLIARGFRAGLVVMVTVLAFEAVGRLDLGTRAALLPFFAASLMGMALARAPAHGSQVRAWLALSAGAVAVVLAIGLALGVMLVVAVRAGLGALWSLWLRLATSVTESVGNSLHALLGNDTGDAGQVFLPQPMEAPDWFVMAVLLAGAAVMCALARRLLVAPRKPLPKVSLDLGEEEREALTTADTPALRKWAETLVGSWFRGKRERRAAAVAPEASDIHDMQRLYQRLLDVARRRDVPINRAHTPFQRADGLARALPGLPVDDITARFVQARYGARAPSRDVIAALARALDEA